MTHLGGRVTTIERTRRARRGASCASCAPGGGQNPSLWATIVNPRYNATGMVQPASCGACGRPWRETFDLVTFVRHQAEVHHEDPSPRLAVRGVQLAKWMEMETADIVAQLERAVSTFGLDVAAVLAAADEANGGDDHAA